MKSTQETVLHISSKDRLDSLEKQVKDLTLAMQSLSDANQTMALQVASLMMELRGQIKQNNILRAELRALVEIVGEGKAVTIAEIQERVIDASVEELKKRVEELKADGTMVETDTVEEDSFVVGQQQDRNGNIVAKRIQFLLGTLEPETQNKILSKKAGETVDFGEKEPLLYILEVYKDLSQRDQAPSAE